MSKREQLNEVLSRLSDERLRQVYDFALARGAFFFRLRVHGHSANQ